MQTLQRDIVIRNYTAQAVQTYQAYISSLQQLDSQKVNVELAQKLIDLVLFRFQLHAGNNCRINTGAAKLSAGCLCFNQFKLCSKIFRDRIEKA